MLTKYLIASLALLLVHSASGEECKKLSFEKLCVTDGASVVLENERLSMTFNKAKGEMTELYFNSQVDPSIKSTNLLKGGSGYYIAVFSVNGSNLFIGPDVGTMNITQNDGLIDLAFINKKTSLWPTDVELHFALEKNSSMFYYYSIHKYLSDDFAFNCVQLRWAIGANEDPFKYYNVDGKRAGATPSQTSIDSAKSVQDWTYLFEDGTVYTKYQQESANETTSSVFGIFGDKIGLSQLQTHKEWLSGGPFMQLMTTHTGQMLLFCEHSMHYGTPELTPTKGWTKVYGPVGYYLNDGNGPSEMYADAQRQLQEEEKKWPYQFVTAPEYNAQGRGSVSGVLTVNGSPNKEWVCLTLTEPQVDNPQLETATYMYSAIAESDGKFTIPTVRPGTYKLHVIAKGVVGTYIQKDILVQTKEDTDLGTINWVEENIGEVLWQIGVPDRTSAEFASPPGYPSPIPNLEDYRKFGTWLYYPKAFPNDPDFTVGQSDPAKDWCYFMPMIKTPGPLSQLELVNVTQKAVATSWKVRFDYNGTTTGNAKLILGFAGKVKAGIRVVLNGHEILLLSSFEGPSADSSLFRQAAHGIFLQKSVTFTKAYLKENNVLEFTPPGAVTSTHLDRMLMWDFLRMEVTV